MERLYPFANATRPAHGKGPRAQGMPGSAARCVERRVPHSPASDPRQETRARRRAHSGRVDRFSCGQVSQCHIRGV